MITELTLGSIGLFYTPVPVWKPMVVRLNVIAKIGSTASNLTTATLDLQELLLHSLLLQFHITHQTPPNNF
jgi:hypothetical protein